MTATEFQAILDSRLDKIRAVLASKAGEYATDKDRLHNFKRSAGLMGRSRFEVCAAFMTKHLTSIFDMVDERSRGVHVPPERVDEKIGDAVNYLILLEALFLEKCT